MPGANLKQARVLLPVPRAQLLRPRLLASSWRPVSLSSLAWRGHLDPCACLSELSTVNRIFLLYSVVSSLGCDAYRGRTTESKMDVKVNKGEWEGVSAEDRKKVE